MNDFQSAGANGEEREPAPAEARADTTPEPPADPGHAVSLMELFDAGFGPRLVSVTSPKGEISPSSSLHQEAKGVSSLEIALAPRLYRNPAPSPASDGLIRILFRSGDCRSPWQAQGSRRELQRRDLAAGEGHVIERPCSETRPWSQLRRCKSLHNLEARALPLKQMLNDNRTFDPKAIALLLEAFDEIVADLDLRTAADREAAKIVMRLADVQPVFIPNGFDWRGLGASKLEMVK